MHTTLFVRYADKRGIKYTISNNSNTQIQHTHTHTHYRRYTRHTLLSEKKEKKT